MTQQEIIENNKLIAEFLGNPLYYDGVGDKKKNSSYTDSKFKVHNYHSDWNELMEVVEKIDIIDDYCYTVRMFWHYTEVHHNKQYYNIVGNLGESGQRLNNTYLAVTQFIKWYNKNKEV